MKCAVTVLLALILATPSFAQEEIIFVGIPVIKISEGGTSRVPESLSSDKSLEYKCIISKINDTYYWTTREKVELTPIQSGTFITFQAINGSGYVRVVNPEMKDMVSRIGSLSGDPEEEFDYIEHLLLGLKTITYYGYSE